MNSRLHFVATLAGLSSGLASSRGGSWGHRLAVLSVWCVGSAVLVIGVPAAVLAVQADSASAGHASGAAASLGIVPKPVSATTGNGRFPLARGARIVSAPGASAAADLP